MKKIILSCLLMATIILPAAAQKPAVMVSDKEGWHKIGQTTVDFKTETDEIIPVGMDKFESIKFKVTDASIKLISMDIFYENGNKQNVPVGIDIKMEGESKVIALNDKEKALKKVVFTYKTLSNNADEKANVELWGLKTAANKNYPAK